MKGFFVASFLRNFIFSIQPFLFRHCQININDVDVNHLFHSFKINNIMKTKIQNITKCFGIVLAIMLFQSENHLAAECSTSTPSTPVVNPGNTATINVNFHTAGGNLRRIIIEDESPGLGALNASILGVDEINGNDVNSSVYQNVLYANNFHLSGGDHPLQVTAFVPSSAACGSTFTFKFKFQKKDLWVWWTECVRTFTVQTNSNGSIAIVGPTSTCGLLEAGLTVQGTSGSEYVWNSTDASFTLNGSNAWPITTDNTNVVLKATIPGSATSLSVQASGDDICGVVTDQFQFNSIHIPLEISGSPFTCQSIGNSITVEATEYDGGIYTWSYRLIGNTTWSSPLTSTSRFFTMSSPAVEATYEVKCNVQALGCYSKANIIKVNWCQNNDPWIARACCIKQFPDEKKDLESKNGPIQHTLKLSPNPASDAIQLNASGAISKIQIINHAGQIIKNEATTLQKFQSLDISNLRTGIYILRAQIGEQWVSLKLVKR